MSWSDLTSDACFPRKGFHEVITLCTMLHAPSASTSSVFMRPASSMTRSPLSVWWLMWSRHEVVDTYTVLHKCVYPGGISSGAQVLFKSWFHWSPSHELPSLPPHHASAPKWHMTSENDVMTYVRQRAMSKRWAILFSLTSLSLSACWKNRNSEDLFMIVSAPCPFFPFYLSHPMRSWIDDSALTSQVEPSNSHLACLWSEVSIESSIINFACLLKADIEQVRISSTILTTLGHLTRTSHHNQIHKKIVNMFPQNANNMSNVRIKQERLFADDCLIPSAVLHCRNENDFIREVYPAQELAAALKDCAFSVHTTKKHPLSKERWCRCDQQRHHWLLTPGWRCHRHLHVEKWSNRRNPS